MNLPIYETNLYYDYKLVISTYRLKRIMSQLSSVRDRTKWMKMIDSYIEQLSKKINEQNDALNLH